MGSSLENATLHVPRFTWRVESSWSRSRLRDCVSWNPEDCDFTLEELRSWVSAHMIRADYDAPFIITSLTGSLLWALNYAHWLLRRGYYDIQILLIDAWEIPQRRVYPAGLFSTYLGVRPLNIPWHDDPYHEYLVFGLVPSHAILGLAHLESASGKDINLLLPGFNHLDRGERLYESLHQFQRYSDLFRRPTQGVSITDDDIRAAGEIARKFTRNCNADIHFQVAMMFLALQKRDWSTEVGLKVQSLFEGVRIPSLYLYKSKTSGIDLQIPDVVEWVRGMEDLRLQCITANIRAKRSAGETHVMRAP